MSQLYVRDTVGPLPVDLTTMKECLKITSSVDDDYISLLLEASTQVAEKSLHGRQIRANTYSLFLDEFESRICLRKDVVDAITSVTRLVSDSATAVASSVYYLKRSTQFSEILLGADQSWPTDQDDVEHSIQIIFTTVAADCVDIAKAAIKRHVTYMYENRGDCDPATTLSSWKASGAAALLGIYSIKLV